MSGLTIKVKVDKTGLDKLKRKIKRLEQRKVQVGYFTGQHSTADMSYAELATTLEYGSALGTNRAIPPRPALRQLGYRWDNVYSEQYSKSLVHDLNNYLTSSNSSSESFVKISGEYLKATYQSSMKNWLSEGSQYRNNAQMTIRLKGFDSPYTETGELIANVQYRVI